MNCQICSQPMKLIPAGISKAGKPYMAFYACEDRSHKQPQSGYKQSPVMQQQRERLASERDNSEKDKWDRISFGKCKTLFLVEAFKVSLGDPNIRLAEMELRAEEWAKASMRTLGGKTIDQAVNDFARGGNELPPFEEKEVTIDNIPF